MSKTYVIQWKSKINGRAGRGTKRFPLEEAEQLANELNQEYPNIHHELLDSETAGPEPTASSSEDIEPTPTTPSENTTENTTEPAPHETHSFSE